MEYTILLQFVAAVFLLSLSPGPDILYVIALGSARGFRPAWITSLGLVSGLMVHTAVVVFGLAELLARYPSALNWVQRIGALYLIYLGIQSLLDKGSGIEKPTDDEKASKRYLQGVMMNLLNPKVSLFFLALFPGFLFHNSWSAGIQFALMGLLFMGVSLLVFTSAAYLSHKGAATMVRTSAHRRQQFFRYLPAVVLFLLAAYLLFHSNL
jgi:threonine/homoserine/homoserine lactone efflux protein